MGWDKQPSEIIDEHLEIVQDVHKEAVISLFSDIVMSTPVDEGRLRGNWFASGKTPSSAVAEKRSEAQVNAQITNTVNTVKGDTFHLTNNLPYAVTVEFGEYNYNPASDKTTPQGFSTQAPQGMVRQNVVRWSNIVNEEAQKNGRS